MRLALVLSLALSSSCALSPESASGASRTPRPHPVKVTPLSEGRLRLTFEPVPHSSGWDVLRVEDARAVLADFHQAVRQTSKPRFRRALALAAPVEGSPQLQQEFLSRFGPPLLPLPDSLEHSRLFMALQLSPRYMGPGIRDAAVELFSSPAFLASVTLSVLVYFSAWVLPEPVFSKAFAAALTVRLALAVGVLELTRLARACLRLHAEAEAARTLEELDAVAERFGRAMGGTALRVLVVVAGAGVGRAAPNTPGGGLGALLMPPRYAAGGWVEGARTAQVVADGSVLMVGVAAGTAASALGSACADGTHKQDGYRWHHLATDKNETSPVRGGPWTPLFEDLFAVAGMDLDDPANRVYLRGHQGPHPEAYHDEVFRTLRSAIEGCQSAAQCRARLVSALGKLASEVCTPGSRLHRLVTKPQD